MVYDVNLQFQNVFVRMTSQIAMPNMSMLDYETMEGARHVQNSSSFMSVGKLAVPGNVGNGQHMDKHTIYKRKVKSHHTVQKVNKK